MIYWELGGQACVCFSPLNLAILFGVHTTILLLIWQSKLKEDVTGYSWIFLPISDVQNSGPLLLLMLFPQIPVEFCLTLISCSSVLIPFIRWIAFTLSIYIWSIYKYCKREEMFGRKNNSYLATGKRQERFWLQQLSLKAVMEGKEITAIFFLGGRLKKWKQKHKDTPQWWMVRFCHCPYTVVRETACHSTLILRVITKQFAPAGEAVRLKPEAVDWPQNGWWPMKLLLRWLAWPREGRGGRLCRTSTPEIWWMPLQRNRHT